MRSLLLATTAAIVAAAGCGPSTPDPKSEVNDFHVELKDTSADRCFETAGAKHTKKPDEPAKITVRHLLVKYAGAKKADASVTRTRGQACLRAQEARNKLEQGADFAKVVKQYSEEPGAATREGSLGAIERKDVVPPFADAAFELDVNQVSEVVETDFGFHVIMRSE